MSVTSYLKNNTFAYCNKYSTLVAFWMFADIPFHKLDAALANEWLPCLASVYIV